MSVLLLKMPVVMVRAMSVATFPALAIQARKNMRIILINADYFMTFFFSGQATCLDGI